MSLETQKKQKGQIREGIVLSDKMDKTIVVEVIRQMSHRQYTKVVRRKTKYAAHDEKNEARVGDSVEIVACRPLSKTKSWRLVRVLRAARGA